MKKMFDIERFLFYGETIELKIVLFLIMILVKGVLAQRIVSVACPTVIEDLEVNHFVFMNLLLVKVKLT